MRRKHAEITDPLEIRRVLDSTNIGRLATLGDDGYPYITPVNFVNLKENIYFHCAQKGEKLDNITRDSRVCFQVDVPLSYLDINYDPSRPVCQLHQFYHSVIIRGTAKIVQDDSLKIEALNALVQKHEPGVEFEPIQKDMAAFKSCNVIEIKPLSTTAKSDLMQDKSEGIRKKIAQYFSKRNTKKDRETIEAMGLKKT